LQPVETTDWIERPTLEVTVRADWRTKLRIASKRLEAALRRLFSRAAKPVTPHLYVARPSEGPAAQLIGTWRVLDVLASGTSATVYRVVPAWAPNSTEHFALKLHSDRLASEQDARSRFRREIRILKGFKHRNVVGMIEAGEHQGRLFIVMELVEGRNLRQALERQKPQLTGKLDWSIQITRALSAVHRRGIVHRDLKPENILTTRVGVIKLADFGLAVQDKLQQVTRTGLLVGTPAYMAPETLLGGEPDKRSDLYSLGVLLHEIFTGRMPFEASTVSQFIDAHLFARPISPQRVCPGMPKGLSDVILKLLEKSPEDRYQTADEVREALEPVLAAVVGVPDPRGHRTGIVA